MRLRFTDARSEELWARLKEVPTTVVVIPALAADIRSRTLDDIARHYHLQEPYAFLYVMESHPGSREPVVDVWIIETHLGCLITAASSATSGRVIAFVASSLEARSLYLSVPSVPPRYTPFKAFLRFVLGMPVDAMYEVGWLFAKGGSHSRTTLHLWQN